jgi:heme-degrading monooxygenase HmoA
MHLTVFRNRKRTDMDVAAYAAESERMVLLAGQQPGFVSYRRYVGEDGESLSLAEWETEEHARAWGRHPEHAAAQGRGREDFYESYTVYSCSNPRMSQFERT